MMSSLLNFFNLILYQPLFNALILLYQYLPGRDFGVAIIVLTAAIRTILYPSMVQSLKSQKTMSELQPRLKEIQQKFKDDKERQAKETMEMYKKEKINPLGGCLPLLIQLPILIALYQVFWKGFEVNEMANLYSFVPHPAQISPTFLGIINLAAPSIVLAILAGITQFFQAWHQNKYGMQKPKTGAEKTDQFSSMMQKQMIYFFPFFTFFILWKMPSAIGIYWITTNLFSIFQQYLVFRKPSPALRDEGR
ncbi:MAG: YidC/Oxa1 family membrane protein insertase [Candidatus Wildermuthbacteria bacterium]|nr:YidC/Oxa1 family membrane protein insertase [Candidatus Wildermuthbacteria bacterium]